MTKLSVNVNKIATLRNARGQGFPNVLNVSKDILGFGAHGITVHPRPDGRHIRVSDVYDLSKMLREFNKSKPEQPDVEFNVEGYPSDEFISMIAETKPQQCTLVPDPPEALTSNAGWKPQENFDALLKVVSDLKSLGVRSSLFIDPHDLNERDKDALLKINPDRVELYTESYSKSFATDQQESEVDAYNKVALEFYDLGIGINAGHDLNLMNLDFLLKTIPVIEEVSIGHALVCESLYMGLETTIKEYLKIVEKDESFYMSVKVEAIAAFTDNYIWLGHDLESGHVFCVDPGQAEPVMAYLNKNKLKLDTILITHHHSDHIGGLEELKKIYDCRVIGPEYDKNRIPGIDQYCKNGDVF